MKSSSSGIFARCMRCNLKPSTVVCDNCIQKRCYDCDIFAHQLEETKNHQRRVVSFSEMMNQDEIEFRPMKSSSSHRSLHSSSPTKESGYYSARRQREDLINARRMMEHSMSL